MRPVALWAAAAVAALALAGCDGKTSAVVAAGNAGPAAGAPAGGGQGPARDPRDLPVPMVEGKPLWAANRTHTAEENAQYQFTKNGADFAARSESDYVTKTHHFIDKPPRGVEVVDRANGDKLMYDPAGNIFAVVARNGAPRTMFKPKGGASYWAQQRDREAKRGRTGQDGGADQG